MSSMGAAGMGAGLYAVVSNPAQIAAQPEEARGKSHHVKNGKGFVNPWDSYTETSPAQFVRMMLWRKLTGQVKHPDTTPPTVAVQKPTFHPTRETAKLRATWLGHACYYVEFPGGLRALFDPVFEDCCAPVNMKAVRRFTPPPCELEDLPIVDIVVISHSHYDHLSYPTTQRIQKKFPQAHFFVPLGNKSWFEKCGISQVTELDWWDTREIKLEKRTNTTAAAPPPPPPLPSQDTNPTTITTATIGCLPCQHTAARTPFDKNKTLWASWSLESHGSKVYFAGDTGYRTVPYLAPQIDDYGPDYAHLAHCPAFAQIGELRGPFDLGLIPIGAYEPRWIFSAMHADPRDSVNIFVDTRCRKALGMHWGTWVLTEEDVLEPPRKLAEALAWKGLEDKVFDVCDIGESREF